MHQDQDANQLILNQQRYTDTGLDLLLVEMWRAMLVFMVVVNDQGRALLDHLATQTLAAIKAHAAVIVLKTVAGHQLYAAVFHHGVDPAAVRAAEPNRSFEQRTHNFAQVDL